MVNKDIIDIYLATIPIPLCVLTVKSNEEVGNSVGNKIHLYLFSF